uniref:CARD domain-containing protein n=3 Tax=Magallana gigas TaxID=29159 RepID=A0A8W8NRL5_MAGGI
MSDVDYRASRSGVVFMDTASSTVLVMQLPLVQDLISRPPRIEGKWNGCCPACVTDIDFYPKDKDPLLPKSVNVPPEILSWSMERRQQFVESMNKGSVNEYSGRGIVIGTADTGKINLVEKLKRKSNLRTGSTRGIKMYSHEFMLDAKECTIIVANDKERGEKPDGNEPSLTSFDKIELKDIQTGEHLIAKQTNLDTEPPVSNLRDPSDVVNKSQILQPLVDICCCVRSKNKTELKRLNLLDFDEKNACHRIFFSSRAFYIVLIDISKALHSPMDEGFYSDWTYADYIRYWLGFIQTYGSMSAPVILVASHFGGREADKDKTVLSEYFEKLCRTLPQTLVKHLDKKRAFLVKKTSDKNLKDLKKCIASTLKLQDHWGKSIPKTWTKIESVLNMKRRSLKICSISSILEDLKRIDGKLINNDDELVTVLVYFHDTGVILFRKDFEEIILDVQWFADAFKSIVVKDKHSLAQFKELNGSGLLSSQLLNDLWSNSDLTFHENRDKLVKHMVKLAMIAELNSTLWYVPCMNKQQYTKSILENCTVSSTLCFVFEFFPIDIFYRLVATCINKHNMTLWKSEEKYCVYNNVTLLKCENTALIVLIGIRCGKENADEEYPHSIEIQAINMNDRVGTFDSSLCSGIKQIICEVLSDLTQTFQTDKEPFNLGYRCVRTPYDDLPEGHIILEKDISTDCGVKCSKCEQNPEIEVDSLIGHWKPTENGQSSGACGGIATDSGFYQKVPETKNEDSRTVRSNAYGMEQIHKDALRRTRVVLVETLDVDIIYDELLGKDIFTPIMMEYIKNERTRIDKVRRLLDDLIRRGSNAYHYFLEVLRETGYKHLAKKIVENEDILRKENASKQARAEIHTSFNLIFDKSKSNTPVQSPLVPSGISNSNPTSLESFDPSSTSKLSSESVPPPTRAESSNVEPHPGGLVFHEIESDN